MTASNNTSVNLKTLAEQLTPITLRRPVLLSLLRSLLAPFEQLKRDYDMFAATERRRLSYNGQVRLLENAINTMLIGSYNMSSPAIYLGEPESVKEFMISPNGDWNEQGSLHFNTSAQTVWNYHNPGDETSMFSLLYDHASHVDGTGFEVHLTKPLSGSAAANTLKTKYLANGGRRMLIAIVDTFKIAGKRYVIIQD